ncbi:MAG: hypothetical protein ORN85_04755 [Sediminibacterium sp.]|nr:hypothetical protein [Sediminibacterium sp.]
MIKNFILFIIFNKHPNIEYKLIKTHAKGLLDNRGKNYSVEIKNCIYVWY